MVPHIQFCVWGLELEEGVFTGALMAYYHVTFPFFEGRVIALEEGFPPGYSSGHPIAASDAMTWPGLHCRVLSSTKWALPEWERVVESLSHLAQVWNTVNLPFLL